MKTLGKIKLNALNQNELEKREMNSLKGGNCCVCSCYYAGQGGSSNQANSGANHDNGLHSPNGCKGYLLCDGSLHIANGCDETSPGFKPVH